MIELAAGLEYVFVYVLSSGSGMTGHIECNVVELHRSMIRPQSTLMAF